MNISIRHAFTAGVSSVLVDLYTRRLLSPDDGENLDVAELFDRWAERQVDEAELVEWGSDGVVIRHPWAVQALAESFYAFLEDAGGENFVEQELHLTHVDDQAQRHRLVVTVQRVEGETPAQKIERLQARADSLALYLGGALASGVLERVNYNHEAARQALGLYEGQFGGESDVNADRQGHNARSKVSGGDGVTLDRAGAGRELKGKEKMELKPCPFCGGDAKYNRFMGEHTIECLKCAAFFLFDADRDQEDIARHWNTRVSDLTIGDQEEGNDEKVRDHSTAARIATHV